MGAISEKDRLGFLTRRADFIIQEAKAGIKRDQAVTYALRVMSNVLTVDGDYGSAAIKRRQTNVSQGVINQIKTKSWKDKWYEETINEHQLPFEVIWEAICENSEDWTSERLIELLREHPMVTVTKAEDANLRSIDRDLRKSGEPFTSLREYADTRYERAGIIRTQLRSPVEREFAVFIKAK